MTAEVTPSVGDIPALKAFQQNYTLLLGQLLDEYFALMATATGFNERSGIPERLTRELAHAVLARRSDIERAYREELARTFERIRDPARRKTRKGKLGEHNRLDNLERRISQYELLDEEQLAYQIEIGQSGRETFTACAQGMAELDLRLEHLMCHRIDMLRSPINPAVVGEVFASAVLDSGLETQWRLPAVELYMGHLKAQFPEVVRRANQGFIKRGVLPDIDADEAALHALEVQEEAETRDKRQSLMETISGADASRGIVSSERLYSGLDDLIRQAEQDLGMQRHVMQQDESLPAITQDDLVLLLASLPEPDLDTADGQYAAAYEDDRTLVEQVTDLVRREGKSLDKRWANCLSIVSLLFEELSANEALSEPVKTLINHLRTPFARAAILDESFFSDTDNPAQDVLNMLARAGATWSPAKSGRRDSLYNKMAEIVGRLCHEFTDDYAIFTRCYDDLDLFLHAERRKARLIEERIIAAEKARARTEAARKYAADHIVESFGPADKEPAVFAEFLQRIWSQLLFFIYNQHEDTGHPSWQKAMDLETQLLCYDPDMGPDTDKEILTALDKLFEYSAQDPASRKRWADELIPALRERVALGEREASVQVATFATLTVKPLESEEKPVEKSGRASFGEVSARPMPPLPELTEEEPEVEVEDLQPEPQAEPPVTQVVEPLPEPEVEEPEEEPAPAMSEEILTIVDRLSMGAWLTILKREEWIKVRIGAYIRPTETFVLVNRSGNKVGQFTRQEMAEALANGGVKLLEPGMMFERALESVVRNLRRSESA